MRADPPRPAAATHRPAPTAPHTLCASKCINRRPAGQCALLATTNYIVAFEKDRLATWRTSAASRAAAIILDEISMPWIVTAAAASFRSTLPFAHP